MQLEGIASNFSLVHGIHINIDTFRPENALVYREISVDLNLKFLAGSAHL